jgi:hypothetical protein
MTYAYSPAQDPNALELVSSLPAKHWVQDSEDAGHYEELTVANAASFGYYPYDDSAARPPDTDTDTHDQAVEFQTDKFVVVWVPRPMTAEELDFADRKVKLQQVGQYVDTLRTWAGDAASTTVTTGNVVAVTQTVTNRFGLLCDRFADLLEGQFLDR